MKKYLLCCFVSFAGLTLQAFGSAAPNQFVHQHLKFSAATTVYELIADGGVHVKVTKQAILPTATTRTRHEVTIAIDSDGEHRFSLLTLGIQAVTHDTTILSAPTGPLGAMFAPLNNTASTTMPPTPAPIPAAGLTIKATGLTTPGQGEPPDRRTVNADNVWFIVFTGRECKLIIEPLPDYVWTTLWVTSTGPMEGHGVTGPH
jgi:hypothetical protein